MTAAANDVMQKVAELNSGLKNIDATLGTVQHALSTMPPAPSAAPTLASLIAQSGSSSPDTPPKVAFPVNNINGGHFFNVWLSNAHSGWQWALNLPVLKQLSGALVSEKNRPGVDYAAIDMLNLPGLVAQAHQVKGAVTGMSVAGMFMKSDFAGGMVNIMSHVSGLDMGSAKTSVAAAVAITGLAIGDFIMVSGSQRVNGKHDAVVEKIEQWRSQAGTGWASTVKGWAAWGASKIYEPQAKLSPATQQEMDRYRQYGGDAPHIPEKDIPAVRAVADSLVSKFNVPYAKSFESAVKLLSLEERDPNRLLSFLSLRCLPSTWVQDYGLSNKTFVASDILKPKTGQGRFRNWGPDNDDLSALSLQANNALDFYRDHGGSQPTLPLQDQHIVREVGDMLHKAFGATDYQKIDLAIDLLTHEERSPSALIEKLRADGLPGQWRDKYGLDSAGVRLSSNGPA